MKPSGDLSALVICSSVAGPLPQSSARLNSPDTQPLKTDDPIAVVGQQLPIDPRLMIKPFQETPGWPSLPGS